MVTYEGLFAFLFGNHWSDFLVAKQEEIKQRPPNLRS